MCAVSPALYYSICTALVQVCLDRPGPLFPLDQSENETHSRLGVRLTGPRLVSMVQLDGLTTVEFLLKKVSFPINSLLKLAVYFDNTFLLAAYKWQIYYYNILEGLPVSFQYLEQTFSLSICCLLLLGS